jgi:hypothetical protein
MNNDNKDGFILCKGENDQLILLNKEDRIHMAIFGMPGSGKSTFMLFQIYQNIKNDEGVCVIDPHGDLVRKVLCIIPKEKWDKVVYIDPTTSIKYGKVIKISLLEFNDPSRKALIAMGFVDSMKKLYGEFWGPRLERILLNAVYAVMEQPDPRLSYLYDILIDPDKRRRILSNVRDENVIKYWISEFPLLKDEAPTVVTNKVYRLIQEKLVASMFDSPKSSIDLKECMENGKILLINLSEGRLTTEVANFLGALLLNKIYQEGMAREDIPENERKPFYVYVDEAYRFITESIKDILQSLRKYKVYLTLSAQYLGQFDRDGGKDKTITNAIPQLCDTLIVFSVGAETAEVLEQYFKSVCRYFTKETLMTLMKHQMAFLIRKGNTRIVNTGMCIDISNMKISNPEDIIKHSLNIYGREVKNNEKENLPAPDISPICFSILSFLYYKRFQEPTSFSIIESQLKSFNSYDLREAIKELLYDGFISMNNGLYSLTEIAISKFKDIPLGREFNIQILGKYVRKERIKGFYCIVNKIIRSNFPDVIVYPVKYLKNWKIDPKIWDFSKRFIVYINPNDVIQCYKESLKYCVPIKFIVYSHKDKNNIISNLSNITKIVNNILEDYEKGNIEVRTIEEEFQNENY